MSSSLSSSSFPSPSLSSSSVSPNIDEIRREMEKLKGEIDTEEKKEGNLKTELKGIENAIAEEKMKAKDERDEEFLEDKRIEKKRIQSDMETISQRVKGITDTLNAYQSQLQRVISSPSTLSSSLSSQSSLIFPYGHPLRTVNKPFLSSLSRHCGRLFTSRGLPNDSEWQLSGQVVCVIHPNVFVTAAHCCFDDTEEEKVNSVDNKQPKFQLLIVQTDSSGKIHFFPSQLLRYSGTMDIAFLIINPSATSSSPFIPITLFNPEWPIPPFGSDCYIVSYSLIDEKQQTSCSISRLSLKALPLIRPGRIGCQDEDSLNERKFTICRSDYSSWHGCSGAAVIVADEAANYYLYGIHSEQIYESIFDRPIKAYLIGSDDEDEVEGSSSASSTPSPSRPSLSEGKSNSSPEFSSDSQGSSQPNTKITPSQVVEKLRDAEGNTSGEAKFIILHTVLRECNVRITVKHLLEKALRILMRTPSSLSVADGHQLIPLNDEVKANVFPPHPYRLRPVKGRPQPSQQQSSRRRSSKSKKNRSHQSNLISSISSSPSGHMHAIVEESISFQPGIDEIEK